ncbi:L,D-transpeptidase family protein [Defluviitalea phaphyphila]|uniref:L,D-transpeptidase family protein n=1 Tax=Defluviitalea phaphyphila TaxID=1473580 RepID=UPI000730FCAC|nr:L,D-transpeptidase family protein [Defluviitalea phaphyphila]
MQIKKIISVISIIFIISFIPIYTKAKINNIFINNINKEINNIFEGKENINIKDFFNKENINNILSNDIEKEKNRETNNSLEEKEQIENVRLIEFIKELIKIFYEEEVFEDEDYIILGEEKGYLKGIPNRNKNEILTKSMASRIICNVLELEPIYSKYSLFEDIKNTYNEAYINAAYVNNLIDSEDENMFYPNKNITKKELENILEKIKRFKYNTDISNRTNEKVKKLLSMTEFKSPFKKINYGLEIGILEKGNNKVFINGYLIPSFMYKDSTMIVLSDLQYYGFDIEFDKESKNIFLYRNGNKNIIGISDDEIKKREDALIKKPMIYTNIDVYIGDRKIPSYNANNKTIIYIKDLLVFGDIIWNENEKEISINLIKEYNKKDLKIEIIENKILNHSDNTVDLEIVNVWYDVKKKEFNIEEDSFYGIPKNGYEIFDLRKYDSYEKYLYIGTIIKSINLKENPLFIDELNYLKSDKIIEYMLNIYKNLEEEILSLVKPSIIIGTMRRSVSGFEKGEKVEILYAEAGYWYQCKSIDGKKEGRIPWGSVSIPEDPPTNKNQMTKEQLEAYVNIKDFKSNTDYFVWTDLDRQITHVFKKENNSWKLVRSMLCSTGKNITPTPRGFFTIKARGAYFGDGYMCKNWVQIWGDYLYHSVIMDATGTYILENNVLGKRASHGCIRFSLENSKWFYDTIPRDTTVWIN